MKTRELHQRCKQFTETLIAQGANPDDLMGLLLGSMMRVMRKHGVTQGRYMQACMLLWENNPIEPTTAWES